MTLLCFFARLRGHMNYTVTTKVLADSEVEISGEITAIFFESMRSEAMERLSKQVKLDGFRPGHIPEKVLVEKIGEMTVLEEMAERAIGAVYPSIITELALEAVGRPKISITKIAAGNPLGFSARQAVVPKIDLPDYKKIATSINKEKGVVPAVTDAEVEAIIMEVRKSRAREGEAPPELTDELVKTFGDFANVVEFTDRIRKNLTLEKEYKEKDKQRMKIMGALLEKTKINLPEVIIERELDAILADMKASIAGVGLKFEDYLTRVKKTEEGLRKDSRDAAEKRAKTGLVLHAIGVAEAVVPDEVALEAESGKIMTTYKDADPSAVRHYVESMLKNEMVFKLLEEQV